MPEERRSWSSLDDPVTELTLSTGEPATDDEIDLLCELARSGTADIIPGRPFAVNWTAEICGLQDVVLRDARGRYLINPDVQSFASDVFESERSQRADDRVNRALVAALEELPEDIIAALAGVCWPPDPLQAAAAGLEAGDPAGFAAAVNQAAGRHGVSGPLMEASGRIVRAVPPTDQLVRAVLRKLSNDRARARRRCMAALLDSLGPDEEALLLHAAGVEIQDAATVHRLEQAAASVNERAAATGVIAEAASPALIYRDQRGRWRLDLGRRFDLLDLLRKP
jgi:hypothetical protein